MLWESIFGAKTYLSNRRRDSQSQKEDKLQKASGLLHFA
jgi:hypothetical protein